MLTHARTPRKVNQCGDGHRVAFSGFHKTCTLWSGAALLYCQGSFEFVSVDALWELSARVAIPAHLVRVVLRAIDLERVLKACLTGIDLDAELAQQIIEHLSDNSTGYSAADFDITVNTDIPN